MTTPKRPLLVRRNRRAMWHIPRRFQRSVIHAYCGWTLTKPEASDVPVTPICAKCSARWEAEHVRRFGG